MRRTMLASLLTLASLAPAGAQAVSHGCTAAGANQNTAPVTCDYRATGPGRFVAATAWPWEVSASSDGGYTWRVVAGDTGFGRPGAGSLWTHRGDIVRVRIGCWNDGRACSADYCSPAATQAANCFYEGSRAGVVSAFNS